MNSGELINLYASHGFLCDSLALRYLQMNDHVEILRLIEENEPELLVINLEAIRRVKRIERKNTIVKIVSSFPARQVLIKKDQSFFEKVRDGLSIHSNGGQK